MHSSNTTMTRKAMNKPQGNSGTMFLSIIWPPHGKNWLIGKDPDAGRDWGQEEKGTTEDEMAGWHHWLDGHEFESSSTLELVMDRGGLACCNSWGRKESDMTEQMNWTELKWTGKYGYNFYGFYLKKNTDLNLCFSGVKKTFSLNQLWLTVIWESRIETFNFLSLPGWSCQ